MISHHTFTRGLIAASILSVLSACATIDTATNRVGGVFGSKSDTTRSVTGGAIIGCASGAVLARFVGGGHDMLKGCAAGGAVGAVAALKVHQHQLAEAKKLAEEARAAGASADVRERTETAVAEDGSKQSAPVLDEMRIAFRPADIAQHSAVSVRLLTKAAVLADNSTSPETMTGEGSPSERTWMSAQIRSALKPGTTVRVTEQPAAEPALVISPVPAVSNGTTTTAGSH